MNANFSVQSQKSTFYQEASSFVSKTVSSLGRLTGISNLTEAVQAYRQKEYRKGTGSLACGITKMVVIGACVYKFFSMNKEIQQLKNSNGHQKTIDELRGQVTDQKETIQNHQTTIFDFSKLEECDFRLVETQRKLFSCPDANNLWKQIQKEGPFTIKYGKTSFGAHVNIDEREITLSKNNNELLDGMLFELCNLAIISKEFCKPEWGKNVCELNPKDYAYALEKLEYKSSRKNYEIASNCISKGFWPEETCKNCKNHNGSSPLEDWSTFDGYLQTQERELHTAHYQIDWYKECDPENLNKALEDIKSKVQSLWNEKLTEYFKYYQRKGIFRTMSFNLEETQPWKTLSHRVKSLLP